MAKKAKKFEVEFESRKANATAPERHEYCAYSGDRKDILRDVLRDSLSREALAMVSEFIDPEVIKDVQVVRELTWFRDLLVRLVGGEDAIDRMCEELWV